MDPPYLRQTPFLLQGQKPSLVPSGAQSPPCMWGCHPGPEHVSDLWAPEPTWDPRMPHYRRPLSPGQTLGSWQLGREGSKWGGRRQGRQVHTGRACHCPPQWELLCPLPHTFLLWALAAQGTALGSF